MKFTPWLHLVLGLLTIGTIVWQVYVYSKFDTSPRSPALTFSFFAPPAVALILSAGLLMNAGMAWFDPANATGSAGTFFSAAGKCVALVVCVTLKAVFGVVLSGLALVWEIYSYVQYGKFQAIPFLSTLFDWLFNFGPNWLGNIWLITQIVVSLASATYTSLFD
jgi:hypothetical protein